MHSLRRNGIIPVPLIVPVLCLCFILVRLLCGCWGIVEQANPPSRRVERTAAVMQGREDVVEVVPDYAC